MVADGYRDDISLRYAPAENGGRFTADIGLQFEFRTVVKPEQSESDTPWLFLIELSPRGDKGDPHSIQVIAKPDRWELNAGDEEWWLIQPTREQWYMIEIESHHGIERASVVIRCHPATRKPWETEVAHIQNSTPITKFAEQSENGVLFWSACCGGSALTIDYYELITH